MTATGRLTSRGDASAQPPTLSAAVRSGLAEALGLRAFEDCTIPRTNIRGRMRLLTRTEQLNVKAGARRALEDAGLGDAIGVGQIAREDWNAELAVRFIATAVRDPVDVSSPLDNLEEWRELDDEQIGALWSQYDDMRARLDPLSHPSALTDADLDAMCAAVKKKDHDLLRSYGSSKLATFAITSVDPPASSPTPT